MSQPLFGERMRQERQSRGMTQADLVGPNLSSSYVSLLESGRRQPTRKIAETIALRLGVDVEYLLGGQGRAVRQERELELRFAELALVNGDAAEARSTLERLRASSGDEDPDRWAIEHGLARAHERCGDLEGAIELLEELRERAELDRGRWPWLQIVIDLSRCYRETGDVARAVQVAEQAAEQARALGLDMSRDYPRLIVTLAGASRERGDLQHAAQLLRRLLVGLDDKATRRDRGSALWNASVIAADQGRFADGILMAERALAQFAEEDDIRADGLLRTNLAWMLLDSPDGDPERALTLLESARERLLGAGMQIEAAYAETELARANIELGACDAGIRWAQSSLQRLGEADRLESARARLALARGLLAHGEQSAAVEEMTRAAEALEGRHSDRQAAAAWRDLAELHTALGDVGRASTAFARALELLGMPKGRPASVATTAVRSSAASTHPSGSVAGR